jgi:hypothetical protein
VQVRLGIFQRLVGRTTGQEKFGNLQARFEIAGVGVERLVVGGERLGNPPEIEQARSTMKLNLRDQSCVTGRDQRQHGVIDGERGCGLMRALKPFGTAYLQPPSARTCGQDEEHCKEQR